MEKECSGLAERSKDHPGNHTGKSAHQADQDMSLRTGNAIDASVPSRQA
jgi:hypothetical protein